MGSSACVLGIDCFTAAGLKEVSSYDSTFTNAILLTKDQFYMWNIGFNALFPKYVDNGIRFPVTQTMQIELGLIGAIALMGGAVQFRILAVLRRKLGEIAEEQKRRDEEAELVASAKFAAMSKEQEQWEKDHPTPTLPQNMRRESGYESSSPLIKAGGQNSPSIMDDKRSSTLTFGLEGRPRRLSNTSDFMPDHEPKMVGSQSPGALPPMELGLGIKEDVPQSFLNTDPPAPRKSSLSSDMDDLARKEALLGEIQAVRRSIDALTSESPSSGSRSRRSMTSRRTLSFGADSVLSPHTGMLRPPRQSDPRDRVHSMDMDRLAQSTNVGASITRPTSVPLKDGNWDAYIQDRKLLQPPSGISPPIATTPAAPRIAVPQAVTDALTQRKQRESAILPDTSSDDIPVAALAARMQPKATTSNIPIILPPQKPLAIAAPAPERPHAPRVATYEELTERHRQKMREMQAPLTQAQKEQADLEEAKSRWEKSKEKEKAAVAKRRAEQVAQYAKEGKKRQSDELEPRHSLTLDMAAIGRHSRHLSADKVNGSSSRRMSTMKVEDWQNYQQELPARVVSGSNLRRESRQNRSPAASPISPVSFPDSRRDSGYERRKSDRSPKFQDPPT